MTTIGAFNQFGWFFFGFGLIFVWAFTLNCDLTSWHRFRGQLATAHGRVTQTQNRILLCTDGLTGVVGDQTITQILGNHTDSRDACGALVAAANYAGGPDNTRVIVLDGTD